jgi:hypothetical protein
LISVVAIHFLAGLIAGSMFAVRTLLTLVGLVLVAGVGVAIWQGVSAGALWSVATLVAIEAGYLGGIYVRSFLEHAGIAAPQAQPRRHS